MSALGQYSTEQHERIADLQEEVAELRGALDAEREYSNEIWAALDAVFWEWRSGRVNLPRPIWKRMARALRASW